MLIVILHIFTLPEWQSFVIWGALTVFLSPLFQYWSLELNSFPIPQSSFMLFIVCRRESIQLISFREVLKALKNPKCYDKNFIKSTTYEAKLKNKQSSFGLIRKQYYQGWNLEGRNLMDFLAVAVYSLGIDFTISQPWNKLRLCRFDDYRGKKSLSGWFT